MSNAGNEASAKAYEPDSSIKGILGNTKSLGKIFSKEKMETCQKMVEDAKDSFFEVAAEDMAKIEALSQSQLTSETFKEFYEEMFQPLSNIKGQGEIFGFALIASICKHLMTYSERSLKRSAVTQKDLSIISELIKALKYCFNQQITDKDGALEKKVANLMELAKS